MGFHHSSMLGSSRDGCLACSFLAQLFNAHCIEGFGGFEPVSVGVHRIGAQWFSHLGVEVSSISGLVHLDDLVPVQSKSDDDGWVLSPPCRPLLGHDQLWPLCFGTISWLFLGMPWPVSWNFLSGWNSDLVPSWEKAC